MPRTVEVIPNKEYFVFMDGKHSEARFTVYVQQKLITAPGFQEFSKEEWRNWLAAMSKAGELANWGAAELS